MLWTHWNISQHNVKSWLEFGGNKKKKRKKKSPPSLKEKIQCLLNASDCINLLTKCNLYCYPCSSPWAFEFHHNIVTQFHVQNLVVALADGLSICFGNGFHLLKKRKKRKKRKFNWKIAIFHKDKQLGRKIMSLWC